MSNLKKKNNFKSKIAILLVSIGVICCLSLGLIIIKAKKNTINIDYGFKNKDITKLVSNNLDYETGKFTSNENKFVKDLVAFFAVLTKMFQKYGIPKEEILNIFSDMKSSRTDLKEDTFSGTLCVSVESSILEKFRNLIKNFNNEIKNIEITQKEFDETRNDVIIIVEKLLEKNLNESINSVKGKNLNEVKESLNYMTNMIKENMKKSILEVVYNKDILSDIKSGLTVNESIL